MPHASEGARRKNLASNSYNSAIHAHNEPITPIPPLKLKNFMFLNYLKFLKNASFLQVFYKSFAIYGKNSAKQHIMEVGSRQ